VRLRGLRNWAREDDELRVRLTNKLETATYREFCAREAQERLKVILMIQDEEMIHDLPKISNLTKRHRRTQSQREIRLREELSEQVVEYAIANNLPMMRSSSSTGGEEDETLWILQHLDHTQPDVIIHHSILSKERKCYDSKPNSKVGVFLLLARDLARPETQNRKRILELSV
jgi:hypothetical protein